MVGFITRPFEWDLGQIACAGAVIVMLTGCVDTRKELRNMMWPALITLGAALAIAQGFVVTGAGQVIIDWLIDTFGPSMTDPKVMVAVFLVAGWVISNFMSNGSLVSMLAAVAVRVTSPGPVIFCQERVGLHQRPFRMYKFRSMKLQTEETEKKEWTTEHDPRVTRVGRIIRKTSIDEMPQFFNILKGDMSLVGPRPERPFFVEKFREEIPRYMIKHQVRPGLTGWAQVNGLRGDTSIERRIEYDLYYIENWTLGFDIKIILLTFFKGFINKNAY